ncbi:hypothetical protein [Streptomyces phytohabitans]|uniref:hypothetical protein n=1 Tax=Streptomyces phytohabitans TaxID=1150371 RepID=UPI00345B72BD
MPGAAHGEPYRFVVDESSFDFQGIAAEELTELMDDFNDALEALREQHGVAVSPWCFETECLNGVDVSEVLYEGGLPRVDRDARLRMGALLDHCPTWDTELAGLTDQVRVGHDPRELAWSLGYAFWHAQRGHSVGCLVFPSAPWRGWQSVTSGEKGTGTDLFFLAEASLTDFWRGLFARENVSQHDFFEKAAEAFADLVFADSLTFRKFDGAYLQTRDWVVHVLGVVHDHFANALEAHVGNNKAVQRELGSRGLTASPESPNTRSKPKIMRQREVEHEGETYLCDWHAKQHPNRNRVHFSFPEPRLGDRILVGIFVDHLDTE